MAFYPQLRDETVLGFNVVLKNLLEDPEYLDDPSCPYSPMIKTFFEKVTNLTTLDEVEDLFEGQDDVLVLEDQIKRAFNNIDDIGKKMIGNDTAEKMNYYKLKAMLMEKLLNMQERIYNIKEMSQFRFIIMDFLDQQCTKDQISGLMKQLDGVLGSDIQG